MSLNICACCKEKSISILFCCAKKFRCRECYQEVCSKCLRSETCHTCFVRNRPDANSVEKLRQLDSDELERLMKTLHLDPSKKSENDWIMMIAQHCGLPMKCLTPELSSKEKEADANGNQKTTVNRAEANGVDLSRNRYFNLSIDREPNNIKRQTSVKTSAITNVNDHQKNASSLHSQIVHELTTSIDDDDESGIHMDVSPKQNTVIDLRKSPSIPSYIDDQQWNHEEDMISVELDDIRPKTPPERPKSTAGFRHPDFPPTTTFEDAARKTEQPRLSKLDYQPPAVKHEVEELTETDVKILKNIQQRRSLTPEEKQSLAQYESNESKINKIVVKPVAETNRPKNQPQLTTVKPAAEINRPKNQQQLKTVVRPLKAKQEDDETPTTVTSNIKDIISQYGGGTGGGRRWETPKKPTADDNKYVIEIKSNEPLKTTIKIDTQSNTSKTPLVAIGSLAKPVVEVHRPTVANWQKVVNVNAVTRRDSKLSGKKETEAVSRGSVQLAKPIEIVSKKIEADKKPISARSFTAPSVEVVKDQVLNKQSRDLLLSSIASEKAIQWMDVIQLRKILRQLNVKTGCDSLIIREQLVAELTRLWRQADDFRKANDATATKEFVIFVTNQPLKVPPTTANNNNNNNSSNNIPGVAPVKVMNLQSISNEQQIRNLNIFQLKSLLMQEGLNGDVIGGHGKDDLADKAIQRWRNLKLK